MSPCPHCPILAFESFADLMAHLRHGHPSPSPEPSRPEAGEIWRDAGARWPRLLTLADLETRIAAYLQATDGADT